MNNSTFIDSDLDPMKKIDDILTILDAYSPTVHRQGDSDPEYNYLEPDCACVTLCNPFDNSKMFIDLEGEFTLSYKNWHRHYDGCVSQYQILIKDIMEILGNRSCIATLYVGTDKKWAGDTLVAKGQAEQADIRKIFKFVLKYPEFKGRASQNGGAVELIFWNPAFDKEIIL